MHLTPTQDQQEAIDIFIDFLSSKNEKYMVIHGPAGSGKSAMVKPLIEAANKQSKLCSLLSKTQQDYFETVLTATTNPAATVLKELTNTPTRTIHSFIGVKPVNNYQTGKQVLQLKKDVIAQENVLIIIDEASMIDDKLFYYIDKLTKNCKIVLLGDKYQLAPVNRTTTIMETLSCPKAKLKTILRNSGIIMQTGIQYRQTVETGLFTPMDISQNALQVLNQKDYTEAVHAVFTDPNYSTEKGRMVTWTNRKVQKFNAYIRHIKGLNSVFQVGESVRTNKHIHKKGGRISTNAIVTITGIGQTYINRYKVSGREIELNHTYTNFCPTNPLAENTILRQLAQQKEWGSYFIIKDNWLDLRSPYASTIHKAQGSGCDTVFIDLNDIGKNPIGSEVARMLYVAVSRARKQVYLHGELPKEYRG